MAPDHIMRILATALRDVSRESEGLRIVDDSRETFDDLACRLILRLAGTLTVVSTARAAE
jgi:hypothetical protein